MQEFVRNLPPVDVLSHLVALVLFVLLFVTFLVIWLPLQWRLHKRTEWEALLKQDMLNRGMSADEIERVFKASLTPCARPLVIAEVPDGESSAAGTKPLPKGVAPA
jgi:type II secretory pathway component PulM